MINCIQLIILAADINIKNNSLLSQIMNSEQRKIMTIANQTEKTTPHQTNTSISAKHTQTSMPHNHLDKQCKAQFPYLNTVMYIIYCILSCNLYPTSLYNTGKIYIFPRKWHL